MFAILLLSVILPVVFGEDVKKITKDNIDELKRHPVALVKYYAPWCGHCQKLAPIYEEAATRLKTKTTPVPLFEVNCESDSELCTEAGVQGYPTLKIYNHGEFSEDYKGLRTVDDIVDTMTMIASVPVVEVFSASGMKEILDSDAFTVCLQSKKSEEYDEFEIVARKLRKLITFAFTKDSLLDSSKKSLIKLTRPKYMETKLEDSTAIYDGPYKANDIERWIKANIFGYAGIREPKTEFVFEKPYLFLYAGANLERDPSNVRYLRNRLITVAKETKSKLQFALVDKDSYRYEMNEIGLEDINRPVVAVIFDKNDRKYVMSEKFGVPELTKFVNDFTNGKLEPFIKSEPIPEKQEGNVVKVVGKTFDEIVLDESKDVLIEFFAPWCQHCKVLKPNYEKLAEKLKNEKDVVIAAIDATANSYPPEFSVTGFPSIFWVPKGSKSKPRPYEGGREVDDLLKFVAKSSTEELATYTRDGKPKQDEL